ncbi:MAG: AraC family transcriptional regulator [Rhizobiaceae bacterium]
MQDRPSRCDLAFAYYRRLAKVRAYVEANFNEPLSLEDAAEIAGLEAKYFSAYFHRKTGVCFHRWLSNYRVDQAVKRMRARDCTITEVAFETGFRDLRTFQRAFKNLNGMTPAKYRDKIKSDMNII